MNEFKIKKGLIVNGSGSTIFNVQGSQGQLFSVTDQLSGSLFAVKDISGIPIMEVYSDNRILMGTFNNEAIIVSGSRTGMGIATPAAKLHISGAISDTLLIVSSSARTALFISGSGNVGIGVNNPTNALDVSGSTRLNGNLVVTGSVRGQVIDITPNNQTASLNCASGNMFTLTLSSSVNTVLTASNIQPGQAINLRIVQPNPSGSLSYGSQFKFSSGFAYTASTTASVTDIVSFLTFDTSSLFGTSIRNFV